MICKIWPIKTNKKGISAGLNNTLDYIFDKEKVIGKEIFGEDNFQDLAADKNISHVFHYAKDENKTKKVFVSGYLCHPDTALKEFFHTKEVNLARVHRDLSSDDGNQAYHIVQSFPDDLDISDEEVHQCGIELCQKLGKYQAVIASHVHPIRDDDGVLHGKCKHNHIIINSHMNPEFIDPTHPEKMKYHDCKETYAQLRAFNDEIALAHGFPIIDRSELKNSFSWYESELSNQGKSWKKRVRMDIRTHMQQSNSWESFKKQMIAVGYDIKEGKYETYTTPDGRKVRGQTLGEEYTRSYLENYWSFRKSIEAAVDSILQTDTPLLNEQKLKALLAQPDHNLFLKIHRSNKSNGTHYVFFQPLQSGEADSRATAYIQSGVSYGIYRNKDTLLGHVNGTILRAILKKEQEEELAYIQKNWINRKTGSPYYIGLYDEDGNRRSLLEQIFILAVVVLTNEAPEYLVSEAEKARKEESPSKEVTKATKRINQIIEAAKIAKEEKIETIGQLNQELDKLGKEISILRKRCGKDHERYKQKCDQYARLKKVHYQVRLAMDKDYCYGRQPSIELEKLLK